MPTLLRDPTVDQRPNEGICRSRFQDRRDRSRDGLRCSQLIARGSIKSEGKISVVGATGRSGYPLRSIRSITVARTHTHIHTHTHAHREEGVSAADVRRRIMDRRAGILGIAVPSGPINLSSSQESSRTALPSGFKRELSLSLPPLRPQKGNTVAGYPRTGGSPVAPAVSRVSITNGMDFALPFDVLVLSRQPRTSGQGEPN